MEDNKKKNENANKKSDRTEFADELNLENKTNKAGK